jgi:lactaldehyde reductase
MVNRFILNEVSYFGPGARKNILVEINRMGLKKALVVSDASLVKFGVTAMVTDVLDEAGIAYEIFSEIKPNPTVKNVTNGVEAFKKSGADFLVAIGGGSSMDTAKAVGIIANNPEFADVVSLEGVAPTKHKSVPVIALPTTAGTAAETTINYVITDEENEKKMVCVDPNDIPAVAIIDAELMYSLPAGLTASTGMDALTHAIEGLTTKAAWEMSDMFEIKAIEMITRYLETAVKEPKNAEARNGMAVAQYIAGMAFSNVGLGLVHGMAHPLGAMFDVAHGVANALLLPIVMEFNAPIAKEKFVIVAKAMGVYKDGMSVEEASDAAVEAVRKLAIEVGIPQHLRDLGKGITENDLPRLAKAAMADVCTPGNPRDASEAEVLELYKKAF